MSKKTGQEKFLMSEIQRNTLLIATGSIIIVQILTLFIIAMIMISDLNNQARITADEMQHILREPLYNIDDQQVLLIADTLISSGKISGIVLDSGVSGTLINNRPDYISRWIRPRTRQLEYKGIYLGEMTLYFNDLDVIKTLQRLILILAIVIVTFLVAHVMASRVFVQKKTARVFASLTRGIEQISMGTYSYSIPFTQYKDIDAIVFLMNDMAGKIEQKNRLLTETNQLLEQRVRERTLELESSLREVKSMQDRLIESGKLSALGQLSAGIAHELNTPLGAIISCLGTLDEFFTAKLLPLFSFVSSLDEKQKEFFTKAVGSAYEDHSGIDTFLSTRKLLVEVAELLEHAGIANSTEYARSFVDAGIYRNVASLVPCLGTGKDIEILAAAGGPITAKRMIDVLNEASDKARIVVNALHSYLTPAKKGVEREVDVDEDIRHILALMRNMLKQGIQIKTDFSGVHVFGSSESLSQVWINLIRNAAQAMEYHGELSIRTERIDDMAVISFSDNGPGIPEDIRDAIFAPFFTTKRNGENMGLGLDICRRIIESWNGRISVSAEQGSTTFRIELPAVTVRSRES